MNARCAFKALFSLSLASAALPGAAHAADAVPDNHANAAAKNAGASIKPAEKKILASFSSSLGYVSEETRFFTPHGDEWFIIFDDCTYRAFSRGKSPDVPDVYQGQLSKEECRTLTTPAADLPQNFANIRFADVTDMATDYYSFGDRMFSFYARDFAKTKGNESETNEYKIEMQAKVTVKHLVEVGTPVGGKLRGYAVKPQSGRTYTDQQDNPVEFSELLPAGITPTEDVFPKSSIFPDETQSGLREILKKVQDGTVKTEWDGGIPVKDAKGGDVLLYMRPASDIEDAETGKITVLNEIRSNCKKGQTLTQE